MNVVTKTYDNNENRKESFFCNNFYFIKYLWDGCNQIFSNYYRISF